MSFTPCKGCGKPIIFVKTQAGKTIPLDNSRPIYRIIKQFGEARAERVENAFVSHFEVCPKANDFSARRRARPEQLPLGDVGFAHPTNCPCSECLA